MSRLGFKKDWEQTSVGPVRVWERPGDPEAPAWIFIHGFASQSKDWRPLLGPFTKFGMRMLVIDLPGHGDSPTPSDGVLSSQILVTGAIESIAARLRVRGGTSQCLLQGNSMGGLGVVRFNAQAAASGIEVVGNVLISPAGAPMVKAAHVQLQARFSVSNRRTSQDFVDNLYVNGAGLMGPALTWAVQAHLNRPHFRALVATYPNEAPLTPAEVAALPAKTLLIWGKQDNFLGDACYEFYRQNLPVGAETHRPEGFSHTPFLDRAPAVATLILDWAQRSGALLPPLKKK